ncbi:hypothetical protein [Streptomyces blastmyceticus]|uniref:Uncharacterized protein n=1 Tax=Streptomyces blastmyceticus TaxID=68180 RepID=A0ABN0W997_9ACTN
MADDTSIKVSVSARDRLAVLAAEHDTTIRGLVEDLARNEPTRSELEERAAQARRELEQALGVTVSPEAEERARTLLERLADQGPKAA